MTAAVQFQLGVILQKIVAQVSLVAEELGFFKAKI